MKNNLLLILAVVILASVQLYLYHRYIRKHESHDSINTKIHELELKIQTDEKIFETAVNTNFSAYYIDSVRAEIEAETGLSRFRDSLRSALLKKHIDN